MGVMTSFLACSSLLAQSYPPITKKVDNPGKGVQKFIQKLNDGQTVKLVYFGQSLHTEDNSWTKDLANYLNNRFPGTVNVVYKAIPGYASDRLAPLVQTQLQGTDPDLIIMQDFAVSYQSYSTLINNVKQYAPNAEVLVWNDHVKVASRAEQTNYFDNWGLNELPIILAAAKFGFFDIRTAWKAYLQTHYGDPYEEENIRELLRDGVHFNDHGQWLVFNLMKDYFVKLNDNHDSGFNIYQAEDYSASDATFHSYNNGYTGSGFMDYGTYVEWRVNNSEGSGSFNLIFRYANGSNQNRKCDIIVNGSKTGSQDFGPTGSWMSWGTNTQRGVTLNSGFNTIRVQIAPGFVGPNMDYMGVEKSSGGDSGGSPGGEPSQGLITWEAEEYDNKVASSGASWEKYTNNQASNGYYMMVPNQGEQNAGDGLEGPRMDYAINLPQSGVYYLWVRVIAPNFSDDSGIIVLDGVSQGNFYPKVNAQWTWEKFPLGNLSTGSHTLGFYMREDGLKVDKFILSSSSSYTPSDNARTANASKKMPLADDSDWSASSEIAVYPNPSTGLTNLLMHKAATVLVHNSLGQRVASQWMEKGKSELDLRHLKKGLYTVSTFTQGTRKTISIVLE